jgi:hypothetical protein
VRDLSWNDWSIEEWNDALVESVFAFSEGRSPEVRRIDTTSKFFSDLIGGEKLEGEAARQSFINLYKKRGRRIRDLYDYHTNTFEWHPTSHRLKFFHKLYLTLLAAASDEDVADIGDFRERLRHFLDIEDTGIDPVNPDLPKLWVAAQEWSAEQRKQGRPIRSLVLPDRRDLGRETLIGYSKRLAFPNFHDQDNLAKILTQHALSATSPIDDLLRQIGRDLYRFKETFRREFTLFRNKAHSGDYSAAMMTPFWGALEDTDWTRERTARTSHNRIRLELIVSDPQAPDFLVWSYDDLEGLPETWACTSSRFGLEGCEFLLKCHRKDDDDCIIDIVSDLEDAEGFSLPSSLENALEELFLIFEQTEDGRWIDQRSPTVDEDVWFIVGSHVAHRLRPILDGAYGREIAIDAKVPDASTWEILGPIRVDQYLQDRLRSAFPNLSSLKQRLLRPRFKFEETLTLRDGILLQPRFFPRVRLDCADRISWTLSDIETNAVHDEGYLLKEADAFSFPVVDPIYQAKACKLTVTAFDADGMHLATETRATYPDCVDFDLRELNDPAAWLIDGPYGQLEASNSGPISPNGGLKLKAEMDHFLSEVRPLRISSNPTSIKATTTPEDKIFDQWSDVLEALFCLFTRRQTIDYGKAIEICKRAFDCEESEAKFFVRTLEMNKFIRLIHNRRWEGVAWQSVGPRVFLVGGTIKSRARLIGVTSRAIRRRLSIELPLAGDGLRFCSDEMGRALGALEFEVTDLKITSAVLDSLKIPFSETPLDSFPLASLKGAILRGDRIRPDDLEGYDVEVWTKSGWRSATGLVRSLVYTTRLERIRRRGTRDLFAVTCGEKVWTTNSMLWAFIGFAAREFGEIGQIDLQGSLTMTRWGLRMPEPVSTWTMLFGGGVILADDKGRWIYPSSPSWSPRPDLKNWIKSEVLRRPRKPARHLFALSRRYGNRLSPVFQR